MEKKKISISDAENILLDHLDSMDIADSLYELVSDIFNNCVYRVELEHTIDDSDLDSGEAWYDNIREDFFEGAYQKLSELFKLRQ